MKISVDDSVVIIDKTAGQQSNTTMVRYDAENNAYKVGVYYWPIDNPSAKRSITQQAGTGLSKGVISTIPIFPGEIYIYRIEMLENAADGVEVMVAGVRKDAESDFGIVDVGLQVEGTFAKLHFQTRQEVRGIYCEYGHLIWSMHPLTKLLTFPSGSSTARPLNAVKSRNHQVTVQPLLPGNIYYFVLFLMDDKGRWQYYKDVFITKKRRLTITLKSIAMGNNSEDDTVADATWFAHSFSIVSDGDLQEQITALHTDTGYKNNVTLPIKRPFYFYLSNRSFAPAFLPKITFPLRPYTEDEAVYCFTKAQENDWPARSDEASSFNVQQHDYLEFITGINETDVSSKSLKAINDDGQNPFDYILNVDYFCEYSTV